MAQRKTRKERNRKRQAELFRPSTEPVDPERDRMRLARFRRLVGRGVTIEFVAIGPTFKAANPAELEERVHEWLVAEAGKQRPS
jgi:hypothetical protein